MLSAKDVAIVYETLLSSPGMEDVVKIALSIPRKQVLLLSKVIEFGLSVKDEKGAGGILSIADAETIKALRDIAADVLVKGNLSVMNEKLSSLNGQ